ncbi:hypothetical protein [Bacillus sp. CGMCC 1.16541]|uniref:hypothetical protein n=1 Tax=Bacillus sp. CGMCC 1.16541 TaxID=2185143 RepID=UPI000D73C168|nr:hypothetical protein [Bacillus sp. CGMCC 1.16541]
MTNRKKMDDFFEDGVFAVPRDKYEPRVKVRALYEYCQTNNKTLQDLSKQELGEFLDRSDAQSE